MNKQERRERAIQMYKTGADAKEISIALFVPKRTVYHWISLSQSDAPPKMCEHCRHGFFPERTTTRFCSERCRSRHRYQSQSGVKPPKVCPQCNKQLPLDRHKLQKYCSKACRLQRNYNKRKGEQG